LTPDSSRPFAGSQARLLHCFRAAAKVGTIPALFEMSKGRRAGLWLNH
jgi:hypothetical protein